MRNLCRSTSSSMECAFYCKEFRWFPFVRATGVSHVLGVHICNAEANGYRFRTTVHANKSVKRTGFTCVSKLLAEAVSKTFLRKRCCHDIRHDPVFTHRIDDRWWTVSASKHSIASVVVENCSTNGNKPRTSAGDWDVRIDGGCRIEIYVVGLQVFDQFRFRKGHDVLAKLFHQRTMDLFGFMYRLDQICIRIAKILNDMVAQSYGLFRPAYLTKTM